MRKMTLAVIGSRETPTAVNGLIFSTLRYLREHKVLACVTSGGCDTGPDRVATEFLSRNLDVPHVIYLPTHDRQKRFLRNHPGLTTTVTMDDYSVEPYSTIIDSLHPNPGALNDYTRALHGRNLNIINGRGLTEPVDAVLFAGKRLASGQIKGGTGMGIGYAVTLGIPHYNFLHASDVASFYNSIEQ